MPRAIQLPPGLRLLRRASFPRKLGLLERLYGSSLRCYGVQWVQCANGILWKLDLSDPTHRWIVYGDYEGGIGLNFARQALQEGGVYIDSGANIGQWLLYLGLLPGVQSFAIEPVTSQRHWLEECLSVHSEWPCRVIPCGLGSSEAEIEILIHGARSSLRTEWYGSKQLARERVHIRKLDDILTEFNIDRVQLWKLDVEGAELDALKGAEKSLQNQRIERLFFECHPSNYSQTINLLNQYSYQVFDLHGREQRVNSDAQISITQDLFAMVNKNA